MSSPESLASERVVVSAPFSFTGSAKRIWKLMDPAHRIGNTALRIAASVTLGGLLVMVVGLAWTFVACWYCMGGMFAVPYRIVRRGQRKGRRDDLRHREMLDAVRQHGIGS